MCSLKSCSRKTAQYYVVFVRFIKIEIHCTKEKRHILVIKEAFDYRNWKATKKTFRIYLLQRTERET